MSKLWAEVVVDVRVTSVDRVFHYAVPNHLASRIAVGYRVFVPFGNRRRVEGYVIGLTDTPPPVPDVREIQTLLGDAPVFTSADIDVARWMSSHYMCVLVQCLRCFLPPGSSARRSRPVSERVVLGYRLKVPPEKAKEYISHIQKRAPRQAELLKRLLSSDEPVLPASVLAQDAGYGPLRALKERGLISEEPIAQRRRPQSGLDTDDESAVTLTAAQQEALRAAHNAMSRGEPGAAVLLHGVTGSGKTEVYMRLIGSVLQKGKGAILLVPDISLTPQTVGRFQRRFGGQIAVLHSRLSEGERYDEWMRIDRGEARVVVGARSAVFAPVHDLGIIIIDEEHESSYKQDETPRYHAREVARVRVKQTGGLLVMGSATPSLEAYELARKGAITYVELPERANRRPLPTTEVIDMREELLAGNRTMFSRALQASIIDTLSKQEQAIVLINRRGFASFLLCRECGMVPRCKACGVSLTYHQAPAGLRCHYCGFGAPVPSSCPQCGGKYLRPFGVGTQRVEQSLSELYPSARIARMDRDTTIRKGAHQQILSRFQAREIDILVGTQMVAKGLDFPDVTLVGVVSADTALFFPDFRASERTFQLLTQVAGRAGRGERSGQVILQTYSPEHYAIQAASRHDYAAFVTRELAYRKRTGYPPFTKLVRVLITGEDEDEVAHVAAQSAKVQPQSGVQIIGPSPAPLGRLKGKTRWHILVKGDAEGVRDLVGQLRDVTSGHRASVSMVVDVDPMSLL